MDKKTKVIPISPTTLDHQEESNSLVDTLLNTLTDIDQELEQHLNIDK